MRQKKKSKMWTREMMRTTVDEEELNKNMGTSDGGGERSGGFRWRFIFAGEVPTF